jgi:SAM-dependent methyltransferase
MSDEFEKRLKVVYGAGGDRQRLDEAYGNWAGSYDVDLWASGNPHPAIVNGMVGRNVPDLNARILDAGCGTGLVGQILYQTGYRNLYGLDASDGMLDVARAKGCYQNLYRLLLGERIDLEPSSYDAVIASGVLTQGHAPPESLDGLLTLAKSGAPIIFSISQTAIEESGFGEKVRALDAAGAWDLVQQTEPFRTFPFSDEYADLRHWVCVYRKRR